MADLPWTDLLQLGLPLALLLVGYGAGPLIERRHYASIRQRERDFQDVVALSTRWVPEGVAVGESVFVTGSVVVSSDYFKTFVAGFRHLFGGSFQGYEALLRMKAQARDAGCPLVIGVRLHSTRVAGSQTPSVEILACGTGLRPDPAASRRRPCRSPKPCVSGSSWAPSASADRQGRSRSCTPSWWSGGAGSASAASSTR